MKSAKEGLSLDGDQKKVIKDFNSKLSSNPRDVNALLGLGTLYLNLKDYGKAITYYRILSSMLSEGNIKTSPFDIYLNYGICCSELRLYEDAYNALVMAQAIDSTGFKLNYYLGLSEYYRKHYESAFKYLKVASILEPEDINSLKYLGFIFFQAQNYKNALMCLNRVQQSPDKTPESTFYFGYALLKVGKRENAYTILSSLINDDEWGGIALKECADIAYKAGQYEQAVEMGIESLKREATLSDKDKAEIHYNLGNSYSRLLDTANALQHYKIVKTLSNSYPDINDKVEHLQDIFYNKNLYTFLSSGWIDFEKLALAIIKMIFPKAKISSYQRMSSSSGESIDILTEIETRQWQDTVLIRFIRNKGQVGEIYIRDLAARLKEYKAGRGICITAGSYSPAAKTFVEARLIDLIDKNKLITLLQKIR